MALDIQTFSNTAGGSALFKALGHPLAVAPAHDLIARLAAAGPIAVYDPAGQLATFAALYDLSGLDISGVFVQDVEEIGDRRLGQATRPLTELSGAPVETLFVAAFDAGRLVDPLRSLLPTGCTVISLDEMRLPEAMLSEPKRYLAPLNFATNFVFFRDDDAEGGRHTRLVTANYWGGYGAEAPRLWATLFDADGVRLATWEDPLPPANGSVVVDSREIRERFDLPAFTGQLFVHMVGIRGHDVVKYALDTYGARDAVLSCTHDANAFPSDLYAGLPAPDRGERVVLWVQNSHPTPIPAGGVGLREMGAAADTTVTLDRDVPGFATVAADVSALLPDIAWPRQLEVVAGKHFVRPRYEITTAEGRARIAHVNVERVDLAPDPELPKLGDLMGKGHILPAPILPPDRYETWALPTPMATGQRHLPLAAIAFDASGAEVARRRLGVIPRADSVAVSIDEMLAGAGARLASGYGHVELIYDFDPAAEGGLEADGWLHAIFRYRDRESGHGAETSFGSHMFNSPLTYRNEPQSYAGRPPGLTTRLFLRTGPSPEGPADRAWDTLCHLVYPASTPWHPHSATTLSLRDREGTEIASTLVEIPCGGSYLFRVSEVFDWADRRAAGPAAYVLVRDVTCRLFGYHGLARGDGTFCLDHMFGF
ncbi:MAG: hypothetical protein RID91_10260 [Azospirillaceae bacterium]